MRSAAILRRALAVALLSTFAGCGPSGEPLQQGLAALAQGDFAAARIHALTAIDRDGADLGARLLLVRALAAQGDLDAAQRAFSEAAQRGLRSGEADALYAQLLLRLGAHARILEEVVPGASHDDEVKATMLAARGQAHLMLGNAAQARSDYDAALALRPHQPVALLGVAQLAYLQKDPATALVQVEHLLAHTPSFADGWAFKAMLLGSNGKTDDAIRAYEQAATHDPISVAPLLSAAELLIGAGRIAEARLLVERARKRAPAAVAVSHVDALLELMEGNVEKSFSVTQEILKSHPDYLPSLMLAGLSHLMRGELNQAEERFRKVIASGDPLAQKYHALTLLRMKSPKAALAALLPAIDKHPEDGDFLMLAAEGYLQLRDFTNATAYFDRAAQRRPGQAEPASRAAIARYLSGEAATSIAALEALSLTHPDSIATDYALCMVLLDQRDFKKALATAQAMQLKHARNPIGFNLAGVVQLALHDTAAAKESFRQAYAIDSQYRPSVINLARLELAAGDAGAARTRIRSFLAANHGNVEAIKALLQITGDRGEFIQALELARREDPKALAPRLALARYFIESGLPEQALAVASEAVAVSPGSLDSVEALGRAQLAAGRNPEALTTFRSLAARFPASPRAYVGMADALVALGDAAGAESAFDKALAIRRDDPQALIGLAKLFARTQRFPQALALAERLRLSDSKSPAGWALTGDLLFEQGRYAGSVKAFDQALMLMPSGDLTIKRHLAAVRAGEKPGERALAEWLERHPHDIQVRFHQANLRFLDGRIQSAIADYEAILKSDPKHWSALNNLAHAYLRMKDPRALATAERAHALSPDNGAVLHTLGLAQLIFGKPEQSVATLKKALARAPAATQTRTHYALALYRAGDQAAARAEAVRLAAEGVRLDWNLDVHSFVFAGK